MTVPQKANAISINIKRTVLSLEINQVIYGDSICIVLGAMWDREASGMESLLLRHMLLRRLAVRKQFKICDLGECDLADSLSRKSPLKTLKHPKPKLKTNKQTKPRRLNALDRHT